MIISLVGLMGAGKTSVGRLLAERRKAPFADTDSVVESAAGMPIADLFRQQGEAAFRQAESEALRQTLADFTESGGIIATGGGIILSLDNRNMLRENSFCVYLGADSKTLAARLANERESRPLLAGADGAEAKRRLLIMLGRRDSLYRRVSGAVVWQGEDDSPEDVSEKTSQALP